MNRANDPEAHFSEVPKRFSTRKAVAYACVQLVGAQSEKRRAKKKQKNLKPYDFKAVLCSYS